MAVPVLLFIAGTLIRAGSQAVAKQLIKQGAKKATQAQIKNKTPKVISKVSDIVKVTKPPSTQKLNLFQRATQLRKGAESKTKSPTPAKKPRVTDKPKLDKPKNVDTKPPALSKAPKKPVRTKGSSAARDRRNLTILGLGGTGFAIALERYLNDKSLPGLPPSSEKEIKKIFRRQGSDEARDRADIKQIIKKVKEEKERPTISPSRSGAKTGTTKTITVKSGDTLSAIARKNNTTVSALLKRNPKIKDKDTIRPGQLINVGNPSKAATKEKLVKDSRGDPTSVAEARRRGMSHYVVIDSEGKKTKKAAVTADELKKSGLSLREYLNKKKKK